MFSIIINKVYYSVFYLWSKLSQLFFKSVENRFSCLCFKKNLNQNKKQQYKSLKIGRQGKEGQIMW